MPTNNRLMRCYLYHLSSVVKPLIIFLTIFAAIDLGLPMAASLLLSTESNFRIYSSFTNLISSSFLIAGLMFLFVDGYASFREDFNFLIALNNTRHNQYWSNIFHAVTISSLFVAISTIFGLFERLLATIMIDQMVWKLNTIWSLPAIMSELIFPFGLFLAFYALGQIGGLLSYRLGSTFTVAFWVILGTSYIIVPIISGSIPFIGKFLAWFAGVGTNYPLLLSGWHFVVLGLILYAIYSIVMHKLPQKG